VKVGYAAIIALVLCLTAQGEPPVSNNLDSTKRDLRALPAKEEPTPLRKDSGLGSTALPSLSTPAANATIEVPGNSTQPSETWLQDSLDAGKAVTATALRKETAAALNRSTLTDQKTSLTPDPFDRYLTQWLSPRDLEILRPDTKKENLEQNKSLRDSPASHSGNDFSLSTSAQIPLATPGNGSVATNPYLPELEPVAPMASGLVQTWPSPAPPTTQSSTVRLPGLLPMASPGDTTGSPKTPNPQTQNTAITSPMPPPTAPVVDDRKYFPQLRRF
jgi:hypothetical protein